MRRKDREITNQAEIQAILDKARFLHLGLFDGAYPYVVPLHYGYDWTGDDLVLYMHGAVEGHKLDLIRNDPHVCVELECDTELLSGGDVPCHYGSAYASVIGRGEAAVVTEEGEKIHGLKRLMRHQTGRDFEIDGRMAASVAVIRVTLREYTAKARTIGPET